MRSLLFLALIGSASAGFFGGGRSDGEFSACSACKASGCALTWEGREPWCDHDGKNSNEKSCLSYPQFNKGVVSEWCGITGIAKPPMCPEAMCMPPRWPCETVKSDEKGKDGCPLHPCGITECPEFKEPVICAVVDCGPDPRPPCKRVPNYEEGKDGCPLHPCGITVCPEIEITKPPVVMCPMPKCMLPKAPCKTVKSDEKNDQGCPKYPCGKTECPVSEEVKKYDCKDLISSAKCAKKEAKGWCTKKAKWALKKCPKTCDKCGDFCVDKSSQWCTKKQQKGKCNKKNVQKKCPVTCGLCKEMA